MNVSKYIVFLFFVPVSMDPRSYRVVAGEYTLYEYEGSVQVMDVEWIIVHPGWTGDLGNG